MRNSDVESEQAVYQIHLGSRLEPQWRDWFDGMTLSQAEDGNTLLTGLLVDQAALHGLLKKIRDLGIPLVSLRRAPPSPE